MMQIPLTNIILHQLIEIEKNRLKLALVKLPSETVKKLRELAKKKSSYASNHIEGNPLSEEQVEEVIERDGHQHFLRPEQEVRNYFLALGLLEKKAKAKEKFSQSLILEVQKLLVKGGSPEKIGLRGPMPPGVLFAVYDAPSGKPEYIPPAPQDIPGLLEELVTYVNTTDDHPLIVAAVVHYQLVTIHPFEDGNGRTARLLSGYVLHIKGYGFNGIGSVEEYFAYNLDEYYASLQMGLPPLYYSGRNNPPHPEIWAHYFLRMIQLYSQKVCALAESSLEEQISGSLSYLSEKEKQLLLFLVEHYKRAFTPIEVSKKFGGTNRTIINRLAVLTQNGFVLPLMVKERIRSYQLTAFTETHKHEIKKLLK